VCIITCRVLGDDGYGYTSEVLAGVEWAAAKGAKIINLSLEWGSSFSTSINDKFSSLHRQGHMIVAAAGNGGEEGFIYPGAFETVVCVGAIKEDYERVWFSQSHPRVDLAAPGYQVMSTAPLNRGYVVPLISYEGKATIGRMVGNGPSLPEDGIIDREAVFCPDPFNSVCPGPGGHVCLIRRYVLTLSSFTPISFPENFFLPSLVLVNRDKSRFKLFAENCANGGGVAAIIYNRSIRRLSGKLSPVNSVTIPLIMADRNSGMEMKQLSNSDEGLYMSLTMIDGYDFKDGTSMAAPHVAGAAASIWRDCPLCSNDDVEYCLKATARDLGIQGRDSEFGSGLIQTRDAHDCLIYDAKCC